MQANFIRYLVTLPLMLTAVSALAHGGHDAAFSTPTQHIYAHIGSGWMLLISLIVLGKLVMLFGQHWRRSAARDG